MDQFLFVDDVDKRIEITERSAYLQSGLYTLIDQCSHFKVELINIHVDRK